jgi:hypothetical protein
MEKKWPLITGLIFLAIFIINFASAYYGGSFSITDFLSRIDPRDMGFVVIFLASFLVIYFALSRMVFKGKENIAGGLAIVLGLGIGYAANLAGFSLDLSNFFFNIGISEEIFYPFIIVLFVGILIFIGIKTRNFGISFLIMGLALVGLSMTEYVYESGFTAIVGGIFILLGIGLMVLRWRRTFHVGP